MSDQETTEMKESKESKKDSNEPSKNSWIKNTYFWIAGILLILGLVGLVMGDSVIRDPGQQHENKLWAIYLIASVVMFINGYISHKLWLKQFVTGTNS